MHRTILVTGGLGFIGSHLVSAMVDMGWQVVVLDDGSSATRNTSDGESHDGKIPGAGTRFDIRGSIREESVVQSVVTSELDAVVHLAAKVGVRDSVKYPAEYFDTNVSGMATLLKRIVQMKIRRVVFASSSTVYGEACATPVSEESSTDPVSPYGLSKLFGERLLKYYCEDSSTDAIALRFFSVYGPGIRRDLALSQFACRIKDGKPVTVFGDGSAVRDYTYIDDAVRAILLSIDVSSSGVNPINIAGGAPTSLKAVLEKLGSIARRMPIVQHLPAHSADVHTTHANTSKARCVLNFAPRTDLDTGLRNMWTWLIRNQ